MRVLMLTYEIEGAGGSWVRALSLARGLVSHGHDVTIWCAADAERPDAAQSEGRPQSGRADPLAEPAGQPHAVDGVQVVAFRGLAPRRLRHGGLCPLEIARRLLAVRRLRRLADGASRGLEPDFEPGFDVVHGFGHRPSVAWTGRALRRGLGIPYLADWADLWGMEGIGGRRAGVSRAILGRADHRWERRVYAGVDGLSVITRDLARRACVFGVAGERIHLCPVGADVDAIVPGDRNAARERLGLPAATPIVCYVGFNNYDAAYLARAFVALARRIPDVRMLMVGIALPEFDAILRSAGLADRVIHRGVIPHAQLGEQLACADVMLLPYLDRPINRGRYPNKIGDYMAAGRPTVANPTGDLARLFETSGAGVLAGERPDDFAEAAAALLKDPDRADAMGKRARKAAEDETSWRAVAGDLAEFYGRVRADAVAPRSALQSDAAKTRSEVATFDDWARRRFSPSRMDIIEEYHEPLVSFGERGRGWRGSNRWYYYQRHHEEIRKYRGKRVLNAACGIGELSLYMAHEGLDVVAFDFSPQSVEAARKLAAIHGLGDRIQVDLADVRDLPYENDSFDFVTGEDSLHHLIKWHGSLESIERVLKPGARAMFCENFALDPITRWLRPLNWWLKGYVGEHSLDAVDLARLRAVFADVRISDRSFFYTYSRLFAKATPRNRRISRWLRALDEKWMSRSGWLRSHYSLAILELKKAEEGADAGS